MNGPEDQIVAWLETQRTLPPDRFPIGIGDDMAQVQWGPEGKVLITTDILLDGVHFDTSSASLEQIGYKAMAVSLSDCAAMASWPVAAVVSVALPRPFTGEQLKQIHAGIVCVGDRYDCALIGGDITRWHHAQGLVINVSMISRPAAQAPVTRSGAQTGDVLCVTGTLGASLSGKHLVFEPRVREAVRLTEIVNVHAMIDISDGLSTDLARLCRRSGVGAVLDQEHIPISQAAAQIPHPLDAALNDGEDFELLFTITPDDEKKLRTLWDLPVPITAIGTMTSSRDILMKNARNETIEIKAKGYDHLANL